MLPWENSPSLIRDMRKAREGTLLRAYGAWKFPKKANPTTNLRQEINLDLRKYKEV